MPKNVDKLHFKEQYYPNKKILHKKSLYIKKNPSQNYYSNYSPNLCVPKE